MSVCNHMFCKKEDGYIYSAGYNELGQLGLGDKTNRKTFTQVSITDVESISCGTKHSFVLKNDGTLWSCGRNDNGQLGFNDTTTRTTFEKVSIINVKSICCGSLCSYVLKNDGTLWSCGYNEYGQLGLGNKTNRKTFTQVSITDVESISCGLSHIFVLKNDGTVWSCGNNSYGQLSLGTSGNSVDKSTFTQVNITDVKSIYCGDYYSFVLKNDGTVWSCGRNDNGQLGLGDKTLRATFTQVSITDVKKVICGNTHTFVLKNDGTLWSCGNNSYGKLGLGDTTSRTTFEKVNITDVKQVWCGIDFSLVIKNDNKIYECGRETFLSPYAKTFTDTGETAKLLYPQEDEVLFLIKSNNKYYTITDSQLVETTLDDFNNTSIELDVINENIGILPDKFSLVTNDLSYKLAIQGLKQKIFMVTPQTSIDASNVAYLKNITVENSLTNATVKIAISLDDGKTYYTYADGGFKKINLTIPTGEFASFTTEQKTQWETAKAKIASEGIDITTLDTIDFEQLGLVYGSLKLKYALTIEVQDLDSVANVKKITASYKTV